MQGQPKDQWLRGLCTVRFSCCTAAPLHPDYAKAQQLRAFATWQGAAYLPRQEHWTRNMQAILIAGYVAVVAALTFLMRWIIGEPE